VESLSIEYRSDTRELILQRCFVWLPGSPSSEALRCIAYNISLGGIAVVMPIRPESGTLLAIKAWDLPDAPSLQARVVHTKGLDYLWCCGCELITPLPEKDLQAWLKGPRDWVDEAEVKGLE
jgi:hypothetical protein